MKTHILNTSFKILVPLFLGFALYMFFRGHDQPGGGFIGGLIASIPFMVHSITFGVKETKKKYRISQMVVASAGLLLASISGVFAMLNAKPFMKSMWTDADLPLIGKFGTPLLFDIGVFMIVFGVILQVTFLFTEDIEREKS